APELIMGQEYDGRADQYALAVTVYEALSGRLPIDGPNPSAVLVAQATQQAVPLGRLVPTLPKALVTAVTRSLSKSPGERFPTCAEFAQAILASLIQLEPQRKEAPAATLVATPVVNCPRCKKLYRVRKEMFGKQ